MEKKFASPFQSTSVEEPPRGTVLAFQVDRHSTGISYHYAALRAANGLWYVTGERSSKSQGLGWAQFRNWVAMTGGSAALASMKYATGWESLEVEIKESDDEGEDFDED